MSEMNQLLGLWQGAESKRAKDRLVAQALGASISEKNPDRIRWKKGGEKELPHYTTDLKQAEEAMEKAWLLMEENAPNKVRCSLERDASQGGRHCTVEWWTDGGDHVVTPSFPSEAESRAFSAFVFARMSSRV